MHSTRNIDLGAFVRAYRNTADHNDEVYRAFTDATWADSALAEHRNYIEANGLGFGDPAFHSMWRMLLNEAAARFSDVRALEIGVYKGQVICLWALLARLDAIRLKVEAVTPLEGRPNKLSGLRQRLKYLTSARFREDIRNANFYEEDDYLGSINALFRRFDVDLSEVNLHRGYSTDSEIIVDLRSRQFQLIYVDGDHSYKGALHDFKTFGPMIAKGGFLVADDAGCELPGTGFWKGHESVSRAAEILPSLGFVNVLNVGHNRIYERVA
jgi:Methyltransferase domain